MPDQTKGLSKTKRVVLVDGGSGGGGGGNNGFLLENGTGVILLEDGSILLQET